MARARLLSDPERIGVYGGTFDPIHRTHVDIARAARDFARLDRVLFVVAQVPPHKQGEVFAEAEDRFGLVEAAIAEEPGLEASRIELERSGPSYTADTLRQLQAEHPGAELFLILGYDSMIDLPRWRDPEGILSRARLLVVPRPGAEAEVAAVLHSHYDLLPFDTSTISSTEVRRRVAADESIADLVPDAVDQRIHDLKLYHARRRHATS